MRSLFPRSLAARMGLLMLLTLAPAFALALYNSWQQYEAARHVTRDSALKMVRMLRAAHVQTVDDARAVLQAMAQFPTFLSQKERRCSLLRTEFARVFPRYADVMLAGPDGNVQCTTRPGQPAMNLAAMPFFQETLGRREVSVGPYRFDAALSAPYVLLGIPLLTDQHEVDAVLLATLNLSNLESLQPAAQLSPDSVIFAFDTAGMIYARYPDPEGWRGTNRIENSPAVRAVRASIAEEGLLDLNGADGVPRLFAYARIHKSPGQTVYLATGVPVRDAYAEARRAFLNDVLALACVLTAVLLFGWLGTQRLILRKIHALTAIAEKIRRGDLSARSGLRHTPDELGQLSVSIDAMAQSIETRVDDLQRYGNELRDLKEMSDAMQACATQDEVLAVVRQFASRFFPEQPGALYLMHASGDYLEARTAWRDPAASNAFVPEECWAVRRARIYRVAADANQPRCRHVDNPPPSNYVCVPLMVQGEMLGVLHLENDRLNGAADEQPLAAAFGEHVALTLANLRLRETLHAQAVRDGLTGLYNRRFMEESLLRETRRATRENRPLSMLMIDIDHFKRFNDTFGHAAGDALLRAVGKMLAAAMRGSDLACRYGGEEFTVILPGTGLEAAADLAEKLREQAQRIDVAMDGKPLSRVTISVGAASFPEHGACWEDALHAADLALMHAKLKRNRVVVYRHGALEDSMA